MSLLTETLRWDNNPDPPKLRMPPVEGSLAAIWQVLLRSTLCRGLDADGIVQVARAVQSARHAAGEVIVRQDDPGERLYLVAGGRVKLEIEAAHGQLQAVEYLGKGEHFGELALLTDAEHSATATAVVDSQVLSLDRANFERLLSELPGLGANLSRSLGFRMRADAGRPRRRKPRVVAVVHSSLATQEVAQLVAGAAADAGYVLRVLSERAAAWNPKGDYHVEPLPDEPQLDRRLAALERRLARAVDRQDRVLLDIGEQALCEGAARALAQCEEIWWPIEADLADAGRRSIERLLEQEPRLAARIHVVWVLRGARDFAPPSLADLGVNPRDFKLVLGDPSAVGQRARRQGLERLVRQLRGTRIGIALGGGGARGLAHLGVLLGLEEAGLSFDLMAGTSSGALIGAAYAAGWGPGEALVEFTRSLTPAWLLRKLPRGKDAYLWYMFRSGGWDRKLRPYLEDAALEQLQLPLAIVAADLVKGRQVVRDTGNAMQAVLESINIPPIARPILRDGMALIDGGIMNNLPGDVVAERGADLVIAVDIVAKVRARFAGNSPRTATSRMRRPRTIETLLRVSEVQDYNLTALRGRRVDLLIAPDTAGFGFADFTQGAGLAEAGHRAAQEAAPQIKQMLADLQRE